MRGTMLWFNETKDFGSIVTDEGERLSVQGSCFTGGKRPEGRCAGLAVTFEATGSESDRQAEDVELLPLAERRRARVHYSAHRGRS